MKSVTAGIIQKENKVLIAKRKDGKHLAGYWEFPGGKIEDGEGDEECLTRELKEELGIDTNVVEFFMDNIYHYETKTILLKAYKCEILSGDIVLNDHDEVKWVSIKDLRNYKIAPADIVFVDKLYTDEKYNNTVYSIASFLNVDVSVWGEKLKIHHLQCMGEEASLSQRRAWFNCYNSLQEQLVKFNSKNIDLTKVFIVFEYELLRERGRRPDVLLFSGNNLLILEFKGYEKENLAQIDQTKHYARDLKSYHAESHNLNVVPILVLENATNVYEENAEFEIVSSDNLNQIFDKYIDETFSSIKKWYKSDYAPLPNLIQSAQLVFKEKKFPQIKKAQSSGIPQTLKKLEELAYSSKQVGSHHLALISGVPGAGKTLVGIQFVFESYVQETEQKAVLLSGNGPLVDVLQYSLKNNHFIQSVHGFLKQYAHSSQLPSEDIFIYDEAQRAWDSDKVSISHRVGNNSEPTDFINIGDRKSHCLLVGLIGDGQQIHLGEESGMSLWSEAIKNSMNEWQVHCPPKFKDLFEGSKVEEVNEFNLTTSLRTHQALTLQNWVQNLLENKKEKLIDDFNLLDKVDYNIYLTRDLQKAKDYLRDKYENELNKTYGLIASSKGRLLPKYGVFNDFNSTKKFRPAQYFVDEYSFAYCKNLNNVVTEFACQGLELDMPILCWDNDFIYNENWVDSFPNRKAKNSFELRKNSYRVLLTRGRDGLIIYVPDSTVFNSTNDFFLNSGCKIL